MKKTIAVATGVAIGAVLLTGCTEKAKEPFRDAPRSGQNDQPAMTFTMPNGFSNGATKCLVPGIRVAVAFKGDDNRSAIAMVADPNCK